MLCFVPKLLVRDLYSTDLWHYFFSLDALRILVFDCFMLASTVFLVKGVFPLQKAGRTSALAVVTIGVHLFDFTLVICLVLGIAVVHHLFKLQFLQQWKVPHNLLEYVVAPPAIWLPLGLLQITLSFTVFLLEKLGLISRLGRAIDFKSIIIFSVLLYYPVQTFLYQMMQPVH